MHRLLTRGVSAAACGTSAVALAHYTPPREARDKDASMPGPEERLSSKRIPASPAARLPPVPPPREERAQFIGGRWLASKSCALPVEDPSTGLVVGVVSSGDAADASAAVSAACGPFEEWSATPAAARGAVLRALATVTRSNAEWIAPLLCREQAKTLSLALIELGATAEYLDYHAGLARTVEGEIVPSDSAGEHIYVHKLPCGIVVGITPWNFPLFVMARKMAPTLVAGCTVVVKTSEVAPLACFALARCWSDAIAAAKKGEGPEELRALALLPDGALNVVTGLGASVGHALCGDARVDMVSMTGSLATGKAIMRTCAERVAKVSLELGGKAPAIVCADCDLDLAVDKIVQSRLLFSGQICNSCERVYVHEDVAERFTRKLVAKMRTAVVGDPFDSPQPDCCSLVSLDQLLKVEGMVHRAVAQGAKVLCGGARLPGPGYKFAPTVLAGVRQSDEIAQDEVFGPVLPVLTFKTLDEAIQLCNDSKFGLTSSLYTRDVDAIEKCRTQLRFGETYVNRHNFEAIQGFHAGFRQSGIGGADGKHGLNEYLSTHAVYVQQNK